jgi:hypothetical protein
MSRLTIFYSWQSDTDARSNRSLIREALKSAIADLDLLDADRPEIDQDTRGVLGAPVIADTIFEKIRGASVFVGDLTLTGSTAAGKRLCNSNVAIELGYAIGVHGDDILLNIMNTHYGPPEQLPFDLAHRRWPVRYSLAQDAPATDRAAVKDELVEDLKPILESYVRRGIRESASDPTRKADLRAIFVKYGSNRYKFKVSNLGPAAARDVRLEFPDGNSYVLVDERFPLELLEHHQTVELPAAVGMDTPSKLKVKFIWNDDFKTNNEKIVFATL